MRVLKSKNKWTCAKGIESEVEKEQRPRRQGNEGKQGLEAQPMHNAGHGTLDRTCFDGRVELIVLIHGHVRAITPTGVATGSRSWVSVPMRRGYYCLGAECLLPSIAAGPHRW